MDDAALRLRPKGREAQQAPLLTRDVDGKCGEGDYATAPFGELYLKGANSFEGYHGKEHLTKLAYDSDRWLKTGYICRSA